MISLDNAGSKSDATIVYLHERTGILNTSTPWPELAASALDLNWSIGLE
ncbi:hypothetical protein OG257_34845 [Streptomyces sp. NBC_00683]|nr:hypothetical protein [Streptomyces sp. NBC_00683]